MSQIVTFENKTRTAPKDGDIQRASLRKA